MYDYGFRTSMPAGNMNKAGFAASAFSAFLNGLGEQARLRRQERREDLWRLAQNPNNELVPAENPEKRNFFARVMGDDYSSSGGQPVVNLAGQAYTVKQRPTLAQALPALKLDSRYSKLAPIYAEMIANEQNLSRATQEMRGIDEAEEAARARKKEAEDKHKRDKELLRLRIEGHQKVARLRRTGGSKDKNDPQYYLDQIYNIQEKNAKLTDKLAPPYEDYARGNKDAVKKEDYPFHVQMEGNRLETPEENRRRVGLETTNRHRAIRHAQSALALDPELADEIEEILGAMGISMEEVLAIQQADEVQGPPAPPAAKPQITIKGVREITPVK